MGDLGRAGTEDDAQKEGGEGCDKKSSQTNSRSRSIDRKIWTIGDG